MAWSQKNKDEQSQTSKKKLIKNVVYYSLMAVFAGVFIYCAVYITNYVVDSVERNNAYDDMAAIVDKYKDQISDDPNATIPTGTIVQGGNVDVSNILPEYRELYAQNNDMVGWICVPDTKINYPVMQRKDKKDYYLYKGFDQKWNSGGSIYVREACDVFTPSDNVVIYGHSMKDLSMFQNLKKYERKSFWENHQTFTFDTLYERHTYQVIAVFKTSANPGQGFAYHLFNTAQSEEEFNAFMKTVHSLQFYKTGLTAEYGDMLLTLSTCEYTLDNGRFVVVAKRIS